MTHEQFWQHIDALRASGANPYKPEPYRKRLAALLDGLEPEQVAWFLHHVHYRLAQLRTRQHWLAATLAFAGLCDDESFAAFRGWVIAHGQAAFEQVLANPDHVAALGIELDRDGDPMPALNQLVWTPGKVFEKKTRNDEDVQAAIWEQISQDERSQHEHDFHVGWSYWDPAAPGELERDYPALWAAYGERYREHVASDDFDDPFAGFVKSADVIGLGEVEIGDTLISRYDGSSFVVLGISDMAAVFGGDDEDGEYVGGEESRYMARVREENGDIHSNQGLSGHYQRRPGDPDTGPPPDEEGDDEEDATDFAALDERDAAIQARIKAALGDDVRVIYEAYEYDDDELPVDNLDERAHKGKIRFVAEDPNDGETWESEVLENPTWLDIARAANQMLIALNDMHHVYLEGIDLLEKPKGQPAVAEFLMGS